MIRKREASLVVQQIHDMNDFESATACPSAHDLRSRDRQIAFGTTTFHPPLSRSRRAQARSFHVENGDGALAQCRVLHKNNDKRTVIT